MDNAWYFEISVYHEMIENWWNSTNLPQRLKKKPVCLMNKVFKNKLTFIGMGNLVPYLVLLDDPIGCLGNFPGDSDRGRFHLT